MRSLAFSLLLVVLVSIFGLGWALDAMFSRVSDTDEDYLTVATKIGHDIAQAIDKVADLDEFINTTGYAATVTPINEVYLPEPIKAQLISGEPVVLETESGLFISYYLANKQHALTLKDIPASNNVKPGVKVLFTSLFYIGTLALVLLWLKPLLRRLGLLRTASMEFGCGNLNSRVERQGISYIADIEKEFNRMAERIQNQVDDNKLLTSAVSHDLRTPLARLRFGIDTLAYSNQPEARAQYLTRVSKDLDKMESHIDSLLRFAHLDNIMDDVNKAPVNLTQLAEECEAQFADESVSVSVLTDDQPHYVFGSIEHLGTLVHNLLQNAVNYAESKAEIQVRSNKEAVELIVSDDGPGLNLDKIENLLKPFQRGDNSKGFGLGLAVVSRIALHHRADVVPGISEMLGGACFTVRFPVSQSPLA